ncbi:MAG: ribonuclease H-like domain-containing protein [Patescibacteria group bacterium]
MKKFPVIIDLETKHTFRDFSEHAKLGVTVLGLFDYRDKSQKIFTEKELNNLFPILEKSSYIIGFNINSFDLPVLQPYYPGDIKHFKTFDILDDIKKILGKRLSLNDTIKATLEKKKTGHGLEAIDFYREGKWEELKKYCIDDVMLTKELFDYGVSNKKIYYLNENGKMEINVDWEKYLEDEGGPEMPLTLPF